MTSLPASTGLDEITSALATVRAQASGIAGAETADASLAGLRASLGELIHLAEPHVSPRLLFLLRGAVGDLSGPADVARLTPLLGAFENEVTIRKRLAVYRRSRARAIGSIVLWLIALLLAAGAALSAIVGLLAVGQTQFADVTRQGLASAVFYLLLAAAFVMFGLALWRRGDPRPRRFDGRWLSGLASGAIVAAFGSSFALLSGSSLPVISGAQRYEVLGVASVRPPGTSGWEAKPSNAEGVEVVAFSRDVGARQRPEDNETLRAQITGQSTTANTLPSSELLDEALERGRSTVSDTRVKNVSFTTAAVAGREQCRRYDGIGKDSSVPQFAGSVFLLSAHGIVCHVGAVLVTVEWSHRYLVGTTPVVAESDAEPFLASLELKASPAGPPGGAGLPNAGGVVFSDRFTDGRTGWSVFDTEFGRSGYLTGGGYGVQIRKGDAHVHVGTGAVARRRDSAVEVEFTVTQAEPDAAYGPTCRVDDAFRSFYWFAVRGDGSYALLRMTSDGSTTLGASVGVRRSITSPANMRVTLYCLGEPGGSTTLLGAVNGVALLRVDDRAGALDRDGRVGFYVGSQSPTSQIRLSSYTVREATR